MLHKADDDMSIKITSVDVMEFSDGNICLLVLEENGDFHSFSDLSAFAEFLRKEDCHVA